MITDAASPPQTADNPLLAAWDTPFQAPPFAAIQPEHFGEAFEAAFAAHRGEIAAIAGETAAPSFDNTVAALECSGRILSRVAAAFFALIGAHSNAPLLALERDLVPRLTAHWDAIYMNPALFRRIAALHHDPAGLSPEQARVLERYFVTFRRAGAHTLSSRPRAAAGVLAMASSSR